MDQSLPVCGLSTLRKLEDDKVTEVPALSKLLPTVLVSKPQNTQELDQSAPSVFPSLAEAERKLASDITNSPSSLLCCWSFKKQNIGNKGYVMLRTTPGNWLIQSSEKLGAPSARASLSLPGCCSLSGQLLLLAKSQVGSREKSEPAEAAWDSSVDPCLGQAHWGFNNAIKPSF